MYYVFGDCTLDTERYAFYRAGVSMPLRRKVFQLLTYLLAHCDRVVPKDELLDHLWPDQVIGDAALNSCLMAVRKAIGDSGQAPRYIQTLRGLGYRFVATIEVRTTAPQSHNAPASSVTPSPGFQNRAELVGDGPALAAQPCPVCQHAQSPAAIFCMACGTRLRQVCPSCGHRVRLPATFCGACGQPLEEPPGPAPASSIAISHAVPAVEPAAAVSPAIEEEFKQVTILCCGLVAARDLAAQHGPEAMYAMMQAFFMLAQDVTQCYEGTLTRFEGDGFEVVFGAPLAHEDHARRAVLAALDLQRRLRELPALRGQPRSGTLSVGIGLHTGQVVVGYLGNEARQLYTAAGETSHLASRLKQLAAPGSVLMSEATYRFVQAEVQAEMWESRARTRAAFPMPAYTVRGLRQRQAGVPGSARRLSPFVGRERELAMLHERLNHAASGQGQIVSLVGDPGMGKSRLLYEFRQSLTGKPVVYRQGDCFSYSRDTPYFLVQALLRQACGLTDIDSLDVVTAKVHAYLRASGMVPEHEAPLLLDLLDVPAELGPLAQLSSAARKVRTFTLLHQLSLHDSQHQPLILALENLHWIDATSEEWLAALVTHLASAAIFLVATYRPGYRPPWLEQSAVTQLNLPRLLPQSSLHVVQAIVKAELLPTSLLEAVVAKAAGNPFFLEELAGSIKGHGDEASSLEVPDTIQAVLAARIDRLPPVAKQLLQTASVIGTDIPLSLLQALTALSEDVLHCNLQHLQHTEFLHLMRLVPEVVYTFKHAITQEVAYQSLLFRTRQQLHRRVAQVMAMQFPELVAAQPALLAHHYTEAGLHAEAVSSWLRAGQRATQRSAYVEAEHHFSRGLAVLQRLPQTPTYRRQALTLQTALGATLIALKGYAAPEVEQVYQQARELCRHVEDPRQVFDVLQGVRRFYQVRADYRTAQELATQLLDMAQHTQAPEHALTAWYALGEAAHFLGRFVEAKEAFTQGLAAYGRMPQHQIGILQDYGVGCRFYLATLLWILGYPQQARQGIEAASAMAQALAHPYTQVMVANYAARIYLLCGDFATAQTQAETQVAIAMEHSWSLWEASGTMYLGSALALQGFYPEGIAKIEQGLQAFEATGARMSLTTFLGYLTLAYLNHGQVDEAQRVLGRAQAIVHKLDERYLEAELQRLQGELLLTQSHNLASQENAAACFLEALAIARRQQTKSLELRAALSLCRLWQQQGNIREAHQLLAEVYGWFTEGFDTVDLQEAQALLKIWGEG